MSIYICIISCIYIYIYYILYIFFVSYIYICRVYTYSDPKVDRIFFGGCEIYVGTMLDVGQFKKIVDRIFLEAPGGD